MLIFQSVCEAFVFSRIILISQEDEGCLHWLCDPSWCRGPGPTLSGKLRGTWLCFGYLLITAVCEKWQGLRQHSAWPLDPCCSPDAGFTGRHDQQEDGPTSAGGAGRGAEWSLCSRRWLREVQGKLEVERWKEPWVTPPPSATLNSIFFIALLYSLSLGYSQLVKIAAFLLWYPLSFPAPVWDLGSTKYTVPLWFLWLLLES